MFYILILSLLPLSAAKPLILPAPTPASLTTSTRTNLSLPVVTCSPPRMPAVLYEARMDDCRQLVRDIAILGRSGRQYVFGTADTPNVDFTVPTTFFHKSCALNIVEIETSHASSDTFTLRYLSQKLLRVAEVCVQRAPHLGGEVSIGREEVLALVILGVPMPDGREGRLRVALGESGDGIVVTSGGLRNGSLTGVNAFL
ncbi:hypothetical protein G7Y79_00141g102120 [Physcia stellaris]|nr:hypothetical protein G7Y79_00141g102120 [Physcia stellaris]